MIRILSFLCLLVFVTLAGNDVLWSPGYQKTLMEKIGQELTVLSTYPSTESPNTGYQEVVKKYPGKILLFGYGSLINEESAARTVSSDAVKSMRPVAAFGLKRIFNYKVDNVSRWGTDLPENERAMLNVEPTTTYDSVINGVVMEITPQDLSQLVKREVGYDLVPVLVVDWNEVISENQSAHIQIAYTFSAPDELRNGVDYTQTKYYPVRGYLHAVQKGAAVFGLEFLDYWNKTTYLSDGTTAITDWDEKTFSGILDTREP